MDSCPSLHATNHIHVPVVVRPEQHDPCLHRMRPVGGARKERESAIQVQRSKVCPEVAQSSLLEHVVRSLALESNQDRVCPLGRLEESSVDHIAMPVEFEIVRELTGTMLRLARTWWERKQKDRDSHTLDVHHMYM